MVAYLTIQIGRGHGEGCSPQSLDRTKHLTLNGSIIPPEYLSHKWVAFCKTRPYKKMWYTSYRDGITLRLEYKGLLWKLGFSGR